MIGCPSNDLYTTILTDRAKGMDDGGVVPRGMMQRSHSGGFLQRGTILPYHTAYRPNDSTGGSKYSSCILQWGMGYVMQVVSSVQCAVYHDL